MAKQDKTEVRGNAIASAAMMAREMERIGVSLRQLEYELRSLAEEGVEVVRISIKPSYNSYEDTRLVIAARTENGAIVAFHGGTGIVEALVGLKNRINNRSLKWKEDQYG